MKDLKSQARLGGMLIGAALFIPLSTYAFGIGIDTGQDETPFGGEQILVLGDDFCTCSHTNVHFIMDDATNQEIQLYFKDGESKLYDESDIDTVGVQQLGTYVEEETECKTDGNPCPVAATAMGTYGSKPGTGTSDGGGGLGGGLISEILKPFTSKLFS